MTIWREGGRAGGREGGSEARRLLFIQASGQERDPAKDTCFNQSLLWCPMASRKFSTPTERMNVSVASRVRMRVTSLCPVVRLRKGGRAGGRAGGREGGSREVKHGGGPNRREGERAGGREEGRTYTCKRSLNRQAESFFRGNGS
jgi:hypothetical protein